MSGPTVAEDDGGFQCITSIVFPLYRAENVALSGTLSRTGSMPFFLRIPGPGRILSDGVDKVAVS
jgi:hypothetical protein